RGCACGGGGGGEGRARRGGGGGGGAPAPSPPAAPAPPPPGGRTGGWAWAPSRRGEGSAPPSTGPARGRGAAARRTPPPGRRRAQWALMAAWTVLRLLQFRLEQGGRADWWLRPPWNKRKTRPSILDVERLLRSQRAELAALLRSWLEVQERERR